MPTPAAADVYVDNIFMIFALANRARRYTQGIALPLSVRDVCEHYQSLLPRAWLFELIFMLDDLWLDEYNKSSKKT
ncbi:hypothetical protein [Moraxella catarrhalis]|uniref:hypothetical protein n=1 Tax=Moraxella catarrhalis TaxID=480 RepID=UPI001D0DB93B|nr:hypothetical protein [Moraxella catarrhalis]